MQKSNVFQIWEKSLPKEPLVIFTWNDEEEISEIFIPLQKSKHDALHSPIIDTMVTEN